MCNRRVKGFVQIACGIADLQGPFGGFEVGEVKAALRTALNIPYFSDPYVNGRLVALSYTLVTDDCLQFIKCFGSKGAKDYPATTFQVQAFLKSYADDLRRELIEAVDGAIDAKFGDLKEWFETRFGEIPDDIMPIVVAISKRLTKSEAEVRPGLVAPAPPGKPGVRKRAMTQIAADFANKRRPQKSWKDILAELKRNYSSDPVIQEMTPEKVRGAWRRTYGDKRKSGFQG